MVSQEKIMRTVAYSSWNTHFSHIYTYIHI